jgi:hypothetical protein
LGFRVFCTVALATFRKNEQRDFAKWKRSDGAIAHRDVACV